MKTSEFIAILEKIKKEHGDNDLHFLVHDYYSYGGEFAKGMFTSPEDIHWYEGFNSHDNVTNVKLYLNDGPDGKKPKIMFRKK